MKMSASTKAMIILSILLVVIALFLLVLFFTPYIFMGSLDQYQNQQTQMARFYLADQIGVEVEEIVTLGGSTGPFLYDSFSIGFIVGEERYTVEHENTQLRARLGLKGQIRIIHHN
jgi:uncharacterized SAM-binding protein YcdF (DUF218 family)